MAGGTGMPTSALGAAAGAAAGGSGVPLTPAAMPASGGVPLLPAVTPLSGKGGTSNVAPAAMPAVQPAQAVAQPAATYQPAVMPQAQGFNVNQASASALQDALGRTQKAMQDPLNVGAYANPYTSAVIDRTQQDIERQRQMAMNTLGAQATAANAFGGSRQGVAEGVMAG